jgi:hypothetical protein
MLALLTAAVTLTNLLLSFVVGLRLLKLARRGFRFGPEFWLSLFFLFAAFLGAGLNISVYLGLADPSLALNPLAASVVLALSGISYGVGTLGIYVFTWLTFRRDSALGRNGVIVGCVALLAAYVAQWLTEGFAVKAFPGPAYWCFYLARVAPYYWLTVESLSYWTGARKRVRIGLADPMVTNRFLLLGLWALCWATMGFSDIVARSIYWHVTGGIAEIDIHAASPIIMTTVAVTGALGACAAVTIALTFFPTRGYRRFIESRAHARHA